LKDYFFRSYMRNTVFCLLESEYPTTRRVPHFAGRRVRMTDVAVELVDRQPSRVIWITFAFLAFDRHQDARAELALALPSLEPKSDEIVVDAADRFVVQGGCWTPSRALRRRIDAAALEQVKCTRL